MIAQVKFSEWTGDGKLRFPVFMALGPDVPARECLLENARQLG